MLGSIYKFFVIWRVMKSKKVVIYSVIALGFIVLSFLVNWIFLIGAVILMILNQKELMKK